jgi:hypothetical protein
MRTSGPCFRTWTLAAAVLWLALASSVYGFSMEVSVTPNSLDHGNYTFSVSTNETQDGVSFHVVVTAKTGGIPPNYSSIGVCLVTHRKNGTSYGRSDWSSSSIRPFNKPAIPVTLKKDTRVWQADFTIPRQSLWRRDLCCVFSEVDSDTINGQSSPASSATFYEIKLQEFTRAAPSTCGRQKSKFHQSYACQFPPFTR